MIFILHRIVNIKKNANKISNVTINAGMIGKPNTCSVEHENCSKNELPSIPPKSMLFQLSCKF